MIVLMLDDDLNPTLVAQLLKQAGFKVAEGQLPALADHREDGQTLGPAGVLQLRACTWPRYPRGVSGVGRRSYH
jgi:hypothetical protein